MQSLQTYFEKSLRRKVTGVLGIPISEFRKEVALKLLERLKRVKLYAHTYAFFLNFKHGCFDINDLIEFAYQEGLDGISAHIDSGEARSLRQKTPSELSEIKSCAQRLGLGINLEISSTTREEVNCAGRIARMLDVKNIPLRDSLLKEKRSSCDQIRFVRNLLEKLRTIAEIQLSFEK